MPTDTAVYIDIHTHKAGNAAGEKVVQIVNVSGHFDAVAPGALYSFGVHPWYADGTAEQIPALRLHAQRPDVLAIGECGLDKVSNTDWSLQLELFQAQIQLANALSKPLIIHCVRAYSEVLQLLHEATVPAILHGFTKKTALAQDIISRGHYVSFGAAILRADSYAGLTLSQLPDGSFFLETDDSDCSIADIYAAAARIRKTTADALILQQHIQFKSLFQK